MHLSREQYLLRRRRLRTVLHWMDEHLDEDITLHTLAGVACLSSHHFDRLYLRSVGESPMSTVRRLRLQRAQAQLLLSTAESISGLAIQSGYGSVAAFSRAFSRQFGVSPSRIVPLETAPPAIHLHFVELAAIPVVYQPFSGRAGDVFEAGHDVDWQVAQSGGRNWRHWVIHPDGWTDPERWPDKWVRVWHCIPIAFPVQNIRRVDHACLPPGTYACFDIPGKTRVDIPSLWREINDREDWQPREGPMLRHFPKVPDYTPVSERLTRFYLPVAPRH